MANPRFFEDYTPGEIIVSPGVTVTEEAIIDFAFRFDPQPFHIDREAAEKSIYGGLIASGWMVGAMGFRMLVQEGLLGEGSMGSPGLDEVRWHQPTRAGDTLHGEVTIKDARTSRSKPDRGLVTMDYRILNQRGEAVMSWTGVQLVRKRPA